jgi:hypothetical protein
MAAVSWKGLGVCKWKQKSALSGRPSCLGCCWWTINQAIFVRYGTSSISVLALPDAMCV